MSVTIHQPVILLIAAGESKRLGVPKQLLKIGGETLINRVLTILKASIEAPITLVLGSNAREIKDQLVPIPIDVVYNDEWKEGMASSIRVGVMQIQNAHPSADGIMIVVCDQPYLQTEQIKGLLVEQYATGLPIVACYYNQILGTPALFHKTVFQELLLLQGDVGAKKIIEKHSEEVAKLHFEKGLVDIDTMEDFEKLLKEASLK